MKTSDQLRRAAASAKRLNHCKHTFFEGEWETPTACCIRGALILSSGRGFETPEAKELVREVVGCVNIEAGFNDKPSTTKDDVVQALDAAYILALQEEGVEPEDVLS